MSQDSFRQELMQPDGLRTERKIQAQICAGVREEVFDEMRYRS